jgi:hypothetical protein
VQLSSFPPALGQWWLGSCVGWLETFQVLETWEVSWFKGVLMLFFKTLGLNNPTFKHRSGLEKV